MSYIGLGKVRVAHCSNPACSTSVTTPIDTAHVGPFGTSITIGSDGLGLITYIDGSNDLRVAHCTNTNCSASPTTLIDHTDSMSSVTVGSDGLGLIAYSDTSTTHGKLMVAHCTNIACSAASERTVDSVGLFPSATLGVDGLALISYYDDSGISGMLKIAHCSNPTCSAATITPVDDGGPDHHFVGISSSVTVGRDGMALISYYNTTTGDLWVAHCSVVNCDSPATSTLVDGGGGTNVGRHNSIAIGPDGLGLISYVDDGSGDLLVSHCVNVDCSAVTQVRADAQGDTGYYNSLTIGTDGLALIGYTAFPDGSSGIVKVLHCSNPYCQPYFRRR